MWLHLLSVFEPGTIAVFVHLHIQLSWFSKMNIRVRESAGDFRLYAKQQQGYSLHFHIHEAALTQVLPWRKRHDDSQLPHVLLF